MPKLGLIGGTALAGSRLFESFEASTITTPFGTVTVQDSTQLAVIDRHHGGRIPPHAINYKANLHALNQLDVTHLLLVNSVGSLQTSLAPGTFLIADDFFSPWQIQTFHDQKCIHVVPKLDPTLSRLLSDCVQQIGVMKRLGGCYVQARGPRFETPSEIRFMAQVGDVVGMTAGVEIPLANELSISTALLCSVDNYANGISEAPLSMDAIKAQVKRNQQQLVQIIETFTSTFTS